MATSEINQFLENVDEKVLECTICFKRLQNPKSLNCLHTFCLACLEDWVKKKGKLTCPTCSKSYPIPEGGLQRLPPNTILNNLLETIEQFSKTGQVKCVCAKGDAKFYCQDCRQYFCFTCSDHHKDYRLFANHKLHSVQDMQAMSLLQTAALHPPMCSLHNEPLKFFCCTCNVPICMHCTITDHKEWEGNHKPISISEAFQKLKETAATLEKAANDCKHKLQDGLKAVIQNATELEQNKYMSLNNIDNLVQEMVKKFKENGDKMKNEVETIYEKKKEVLDVQMDELETTITDINRKLDLLNQILKSDEATAMQSSERVITALKDRINELPKSEPNVNGHIRFLINKQQIASLQQCDIGIVTQQLRAADCLKLKGWESVSQGQTIVVKVIKTDECKIHVSQLKTTWTHPAGETNIAQVQEEDNGNYFVTENCTSPGLCKLDVSADGEPIKQSPMLIKVEKEGLVNTIKINKKVVIDVGKCEEDCLLVSCETNEILKYKPSGEYIGKVTLPRGVKVFGIYTMKDSNIAFSDDGSKCIKICNMDGQVIKSIGQGVLKTPNFFHVDEVSNVVYVADFVNASVFMFSIDNDKTMKKIGSTGKQGGQMNRVINVTLTNQGNILVLEVGNSGLKLFDTEGRFMKVLVEAGAENGKVWNPRGVVVDEDDNIIVSSEHKLQLFSSDGNFIRQIDKPEDGIREPWGLTIISHHPRRVAVANSGDKTVKIFTY